MIHIKYFLNHLFFLILKISFICFFLAPLGLCCCVRVFSSCGEQGLPSSCGVPASHCGGFSCCGARPQWLWPMGLVAPQHVECSQTRDRTCVFCIGRQILNHWTTRKGPYKVLGVAPRKCLLNVQCCCCCWCWYCPAVKSEEQLLQTTQAVQSERGSAGWTETRTTLTWISSRPWISAVCLLKTKRQASWCGPSWPLSHSLGSSHLIVSDLQTCPSLGRGPSCSLCLEGPSPTSSLGCHCLVTELLVQMSFPLKSLF